VNRALWITWYALPDADSAAYRSWLEARNLPKVLDRARIRWAAHDWTEPNPPMSDVPRGEPGRLRTTDDFRVPAPGSPNVASRLALKTHSGAGAAAPGAAG
jgi:hypothetical protein